MPLSSSIAQALNLRNRPKLGEQAKRMLDIAAFNAQAELPAVQPRTVPPPAPPDEAWIRPRQNVAPPIDPNVTPPPVAEAFVQPRVSALQPASTPQPAPLDERLPDGRTVDDAVAAVRPRIQQPNSAPPSSYIQPRSLPQQNSPAQTDAPADWQTISRDALTKPAPTFNPRATSPTDASLTPADERAGLIMARAGATPDPSNAADDGAVRPRTPAQTADPLERLQSSYDRILALEAAPVKNHNGRFRGALKSFVRLLPTALAGAAQSGVSNPFAALLGGLITAAGGGVVGAFDQSLDEQLLKQKHVTKAIQDFQRELLAAKSVADVRNVLASAGYKEAQAAGGASSGKQAGQQRSFATFLSKYFPDGYKRGTRKDIDTELDRLGMEPPPALPKKGGGRPLVATPGQGVLVPDGAGGYTFLAPHDEEGGPAPAMTEAQRAQTDTARRELNIRLAEYNLRAARAHQPQLTFDDWLHAGSPAAPAGVEAHPSTEPTTPATTATPSDSPHLVPSGAQTPNIPGGHRRSGSRHGGSRSSSGGGGGDLKGAGISLHNINSLATQIKTAESRGYTDEAAAMRAQLEQERETARKLHAGQIELKEDGSAAWKGSTPQTGQPPARPKLKVPWLPSPLDKEGRAARGKH